MLSTLRERIELLERVADKLEYRGIEPASDVEKLRVFASQLKDVEENVKENQAEFIKELRFLKRRIR